MTVQRWEGIDLAPDPAMITIAEGPYKGFKMATDDDRKPDPARAEKCYQELKSYQGERERLANDRRRPGTSRPGRKRH